MTRTFQCIPDGQFYTIPKLETYLKFDYLTQCVFESKTDQQEVRRKGLDKLNDNGVSKESQELGNKFIKKIETSYIPNVSIRRINEQVGYGLFSEEDLKVGCYVGEYAGVIRKNDRRYFEPLNNYCYEYPVPDCYGRSFVIDATNGNLTRFINHSFNPNLKPMYAFYEGFYHIIFLAIQPIEKGTQLSYNYGKSYWYIREPPTNL